MVIGGGISISWREELDGMLRSFFVGKASLCYEIVGIKQNNLIRLCSNNEMLNRCWWIEQN